MNPAAASRAEVVVDGKRLEVATIAGDAARAPIVLLHEGLGSIAMWRDFPQQLAARSRRTVVAYSRYGHGGSEPLHEAREVGYMHHEGRVVLPALLTALGIRAPVLFGHSDGGSIATIYAGSVQDHRVRGLVLMAAHFFTEEMGLNSIRRTRDEFASGDLREKLKRWHADVDGAFQSWVEPWLNPDFKSWDITDALGYIRVPILVIQGADDEYGTLKQVEAVQQECYCPVETVIVPGAKHSPYRDAPEATLSASSAFINRLLRDHHEGETGATKPLHRTAL